MLLGRSISVARDRRTSDARYSDKRKADPDFRFRETQLWRRISKQVRARDPLCKMCEARGVIEPSMEVDHIEPPRGRFELQVSLNNLQGLCTSCHSLKTRQQKSGAPIKGYDVNGAPTDPSHPWNLEKHHRGVSATRDELPLPADAQSSQS